MVSFVFIINERYKKELTVMKFGLEMQHRPLSVGEGRLGLKHKEEWYKSNL